MVNKQFYKSLSELDMTFYRYLLFYFQIKAVIISKKCFELHMYYTEKRVGSHHAACRSALSDIKRDQHAAEYFISDKARPANV